ncbi:mrna capping beta chain protein [Cystoisospora suis]|uniref:mRNA 5'-phosphatase n=1 Tax=Cystoisospora suis TaxID=483139 RepID=A0A2C6L9H1_9APIC|nr:mrna capping beta chain protein [Cystoisospora suis]
MIVEDTPCLLEALNASLASSISGSGATPLSASCPPSAVPLELEIEGRLGVLIDLDTSSRLRLPVTSLALLSSSFCSRRLDGDPGEAQSAGLRFDAGVSQQQFSSVRDFMSAVCGKKGSGPGVTDIRTVHIQGNGRQENQEDANVSTREGRPSRGQLFSSVGSETEGSILDDWVSLVDSDEFFGDEEVSLSDCPSRMKELAQGREKEETISASRKTKKTEDVLENPDTWIPLPIQMTEEEYHQFPALLGDTSIRVSYPCQSSNAGLRVPTGAIWKENHMTWNLYSGKDNDQEWAEGDSKRAADLDIDEGASRRRKVDCRVAVNIEHHPNLKEIMKELDRKSKQTACPGQNQQAPVISRMRKRQSFIHPCGVRVDLTEVLVKIGGNRAPGRSGREKMLYEIEVELNPTLVLQAVKYKQMTGDSLPLLALCVSFLAVLEDLSVHLNVAFSASDTALGAKGAGESSGSRRGAASGKLSEERFADLTRSFPPSACVARYREYLSPCLPLVGDYGFRAVAPELERRDDKKLRDYLAKINVDEESLYTNDTVTIMGPWVPCLNEEGRIEFAVPVAARPRAGA